MQVYELANRNGQYMLEPKKKVVEKRDQNKGTQDPPDLAIAKQGSAYSDNTH